MGWSESAVDAVFGQQLPRIGPPAHPDQRGTRVDQFGQQSLEVHHSQLMRVQNR